MGMFDEFVLKKPIKCPKCKKEKIKIFQTQEFENLLGRFKEGQRAVYYGYRAETKEEKKIKIKRLKKLYPKAGDSFYNMCGYLRKTRKIIGRIYDGKYKVYGLCRNCNILIYATAIVKNGIFKGIK